MDEGEWLAERFEADRPRLRAVAYRMLGSLAEAEDAVQEAWLRVSRADSSVVANLGGWLTTVVARVCLTMLQTRASRREQPLDARVPDPVVSGVDGGDPDQEGLLAASVGLAWRGVLNRWPRRSGLGSCCMTCSGCPSMRSRRSSAGHRGRRGSWRAEPAAGCGERVRSPTPIWPGSGKWSTRSWPPPAPATSMRCLPCSTPTSCCTPTVARCPQAPPARSAARRR